MSKSLVKRFRTGLVNLRSDERGAESSEVILVLVLLVVGLMATFAFLRNKLGEQTTKVSNCIGSANTATKC